MSKERAGGKRLGDRLVESGAFSRDEVEAAAHAARVRNLPIGKILSELGGSTKDRDIYAQLAGQRGLTFAEAEELIHLADPSLFPLVPRNFLEHQRVLPIARAGADVVVATCNPDADVPDLATALGARRVDLRLVTPLDFRRLRMTLDCAAAQAGHSALAGPRPRDLLTRDEHVSSDLITLFESMLLDAIAERASDIHLERYGDRVRVRLRIDGDLHDVAHFRITVDQLVGLLNVIKIDADLDISERRLPQGGRFTVRTGQRAFDLRIQTQPALHGEHAVIRILPQDAKPLTIEELGFSPGTARAYGRLLESPAGLVLVVGPTGSGKSTTLYGALQLLARDATRKVLTIEDPIEYAVDGVQQSQARPEVGFQFASAMRAFVREDPDVILVGEIRDGETALEAIRASQTGHLVLSTLHCNDAVDAVQRLFDLGMHANSIASELLAVFAQRLAKRICGRCGTDATLDAELAAEVFPHGAPDGFRARKGTGCFACGHLGTRGRIAVVEYLPASPAVRGAIARRLPVDDLRGIALGAGLVPMREHALGLVQRGVIAFEEMRGLLPPERLRPEPVPRAP